VGRVGNNPVAFDRIADHSLLCSQYLPLAAGMREVNPPRVGAGEIIDSASVQIVEPCFMKQVQGATTMSTLQVVIRGTLTSDGSLILAERPSLPSGPVEVIIRSLPTSDMASEDFLHYLQRARAELEAAGTGFRTKEEIDAELEELRSGDKRLEEVYKQVTETHRSEQGHEC
jgi:hypothetical protein